MYLDLTQSPRTLPARAGVTRDHARPGEELGWRVLALPSLDSDGVTQVFNPEG